MVDIINTIVCPIIRQDHVLPMLRSLKQNTPANFRTIVINQTQPNREFEAALYEEADYIIRGHYNLGFAQSVNLGIRLASTPYVCACNDDVIFINDAWWNGVIETFERFETAAAVNPQSPKEPGWGWGEPGYRYKIPKAFMTEELQKLHDADRAAMQVLKAAKQALEETQRLGAQDWELQVRRKELEAAGSAFQNLQRQLEARTFEFSKNLEYIKSLVEEANWAVVDAFACWCTVFKAEVLEKIGLFDERFFPGGGEDYCWQHRCYKLGYRALSSSRSWVWHWWGQSKDHPRGFDTALPNARAHWNKLSTKGFGKEGLYDPDCGVWGEGERTDPVIYRAPL